MTRNGKMLVKFMGTVFVVGLVGDMMVNGNVAGTLKTLALVGSIFGLMYLLFKVGSLIGLAVTNRIRR